MSNPCQKSCEECAVRDEIRCGGCRYVRDTAGCEIAQCASKNNHANCGTCILRTSCPTKRNASSMHKIRAEKAAAEEQRQNRLHAHAALLGKWLHILFWLMIADLILGLLTSGSVTENLPAVSAGADILVFLLGLSRFYVIWQLRDVHPNYRKAAVCQLITVVLTAVVDFLAAGLFASMSETAAAAVTLLIGLPGSVLAIVATYQLYNAHAWATAEADLELSIKWERLWAWQIGLLIGTLCSPILTFLGLIGALVILACFIGVFVVGILELVYLRRTADLFRFIASE